MSEQIQRVGNYILLEKLAVGGMAEVYLAKIVSSDKLVAIKKILSAHSNTAEYVKLFQEEVKVSLHLKHGNIISYYDYFFENDVLYLVMEFVNGFTLRKLVGDLKFKNEKMAWAHALYVVAEVAAGLDHAHRSVDSITHQKLNIIHRDINPHNIMVGFDGNVKIIDFGIAKADSRADVTKVGTIKGKFSYMSPEQAAAQPLDNRSDIYALGIVFWELLAGKKMHEGRNDLETLKKIRSTEIKSPREIDSNIPVELEMIVMRALERDPNQRYQKASDLRFDIIHILNQGFPNFRPSDFADFIAKVYAELIRARIEKFSYFAKVKIENDGLPRVPNSTNAPVATAQVASFPIELPEGFETKIGSVGTNKKGPLNFEHLKSEKQIFAAEVKTFTKQKAANFFGENRLQEEDEPKNSFNLRKILENSFLWNLKHLALILIVIYAGYSFNKQFIDPNVASEFYKFDQSSLSTTVGSADASQGQVSQASFNQGPTSDSDDFSAKFFKKMKASGKLSYVNIKLENTRPSETNIYVDGKIIYDKAPVRKFPIYANQTVTIVAYNPRMKLYDEKKIVIPSGRTMNVNLNLRPYKQK